MSDSSTNPNTRFLLSAKEVVKATGLSRTSIWRLCRAGKFPSPLSISTSRIAWSYASISEWVNSRPLVNQVGESKENSDE